MIENIFEYIEYIEKNFSERVAFQYCEKGEVHKKSYKEYVKDIKEFALYLKSESDSIEGKHIGIVTRDTYRFAVCILGGIYAKAVVVPLNIEEEETELLTLIKDADVEIVFIDDKYKKKESIEKIVRCDNIYKKKEKVLTDEVELKKQINQNMPSVILFSSGTLGKRKAIMLSQKALFGNMGYSLNQLGDNRKKVNRVFDMNPLYHVGGLVATVANNGLGATINLCTSVKYIYRDLKKMDSDSARITPAVLELWNKKIKKEGTEWLGSLRLIICGASFVNTDLFETFQKEGIWVVQAYGLSEIGGCVTLNLSDKIKSVGKAGQGVELRIEDGEVCVKSGSVMLGYYKDEEATSMAIKDGWLYTGDLGYLDDEGYLYLTGRKKNLIILPGGENVSPEELEALLYLCPEIEEVVVKEEDKKICAEIFCAKENQERVSKYIVEKNRKLPYYKRISMIKFRKENFARTGSDKIKRN